MHDDALLDVRMPGSDHTPLSSTTDGPPTHVVVLSPHQLTRAGITVLLADVPGVVVQSPDYLARSTHRGHASPGSRTVAIFDLATLSGRETAILARLVANPSLTVLALIDDMYPLRTTLALNIGVDGCLLMSSPVSDLIDAVTGAAPEHVLSPVTRHKSAWTLSPREIDVLLLIAQGRSNIEIGEELFLSVNTVKTYIRTAYGKIGVTSRSQAVGWCITNRLSQFARNRMVHDPPPGT